MIRSRNQNSILAVATLGVYLGLILAGATPTVLAQAATAKQFSVKDEAGRRDDLDKKPDGCDSLATKVKEKHAKFEFAESDLLAYANGIVESLGSYKKLHGDLLSPEWSRALEQLRLAEAAQKPVLVDARSPHRPQDEQPPVALSGILPGTAFEFSITSNGYDLVVAAGSTHKDNTEAHRIAIAYAAVLDLYRCSLTNPAQKVILYNTEVAWSDNGILLVTHLPRGSLDTLLASNAK